mmetsp:Transcript_2680/g.3164  ORF Transcript_2680/g.3164 Transcript_2680/m.3164 type:complete len:240 (-) Transcript_2680:192-911(-)
MSSFAQTISRRLISQSLRLTTRTQVPVVNRASHIFYGRNFSSLPYHIVMGMPALSPTMEAGTISSWKVAEGEAFVAGDSLAEIETDKATIDFEAQDDGVIAKILVQAGSDEVKVGVPIVVTVEEEEDVAAFQDFVPPEAEAAVAEENPVAVAPVVKKVAPPAPAVPAPAPAVPAPAPVVPEPAPVETMVTAEPVPQNPSSLVSPGWGNFAKVKSPLASTLSASQKKYIELYGSAGQVPI